jgi:esterase
MIRIGDGSLHTVVLHGFLGQAKNLRTLAQRWSEKDPSRTFLLLDLPGHGEAQPLREGLDLPGMAIDVLDRAAAAGLVAPFDLVGHSLGGRVSLAASLARPRDVLGVTLLDIGPSPIATETSDSHAVLQKLRAAPAEAADRRALREALVHNGISGPLADWLAMNVVQEDGRAVWRFDRDALHRVHLRVNPEDLWEAVERPGAKVRCIRGGRSGYVSDEDAARLQRAGCEVVTVPGAGHFLHQDAQDAVLDALVGFQW